MEKMITFKAMLIGMFGAVGSFFVQLLGGWTSDMQALIIFMAIDVITGFLIAAVWKKSPKSETDAAGSLPMWTGLCRKGVSLLIVLVAYQLDIALGMEYIRTAVIISFIVNELVSIIENAGIMGIPIPAVIIKAIDILKKKEDGA